MGNDLVRRGAGQGDPKVQEMTGGARDCALSQTKAVAGAERNAAGAWNCSNGR